MASPTVLIGEQTEEFDPEEITSPRLAVGLLGEQVREKWVCHHCQQSPCLVYVERYTAKNGEGVTGSSFALCAACVMWALAPDKPVIKRLAEFMEKKSASVGLIFNEAKGDTPAQFAVMSEFGREAPDSPMAGGAIYGMQDTLVESLDQALRDARM